MRRVSDSSFLDAEEGAWMAEAALHRSGAGRENDSVCWHVRGNR